MDSIEEIHHDPTVLEKSVFAVTAVFSFFGNLALCLVIIKGKILSNNSDILLVFNISTAGLLTGKHKILFLLNTFTPRVSYGDIN